MKNTTLPTYEVLNKALDKTNLKLHTSQVHGLVSGLLCGSTSPAAAWEDLVTGGKTSKGVHDVLQTLYNASKQQLDESLFEFTPALPPDDMALPERAEALTLWCQGVLTGLKMANVQIVGREPGEVTEAIEDLIEIAKMNYEEVVASEEDEEAYMELVEYVRMAVILIYQSTHEADAKISANKSSHLH